MEINQKYIEAALNNNYWDLGNSYLYKLCKENPEHNSTPVILAKTWLIGRAYSVALERKRIRTEEIDKQYGRFCEVSLMIKYDKILLEYTRRYNQF